jgi:hypothetical protein
MVALHLPSLVLMPLFWLPPYVYFIRFIAAFLLLRWFNASVCLRQATPRVWFIALQASLAVFGCAVTVLADSATLLAAATVWAATQWTTVWRGNSAYVQQCISHSVSRWLYVSHAWTVFTTCLLDTILPAAGFFIWFLTMATAFIQVLYLPIRHGLPYSISLCSFICAVVCLVGTTGGHILFMRAGFT